MCIFSIYNSYFIYIYVHPYKSYQRIFYYITCMCHHKRGIVSVYYIFYSIAHAQALHKRRKLPGTCQGFFLVDFNLKLNVLIIYIEKILLAIQYYRFQNFIELMKFLGKFYSKQSFYFSLLIVKIQKKTKAQIKCI